MNLLKSAIIILLLFSTMSLQAQKYFTRSGTITFSSEAPLEKIEAVNKKATSVIDVASGKMEFAVLIKAFQFEKALMQEHFNENYMESDKYPKAKFKGAIENMSSVDLANDGSYPVIVKGQLTIHGVTKEVETKGTFIVKDGEVSADASFEVIVADYKIEIPSVVKDNIAKTVQIDIVANYEPFKKNKQLTQKN